MNLIPALRLPAAPRVGFAGAGGKTAALFRLAREYGNAWVTTTTHLSVAQAALADHHFFGEEGILPDPPRGVVLFTAPVAESRLGAMDSLTLNRVLTLADSLQMPLLIEADGARRLPLKAPAEHEPVIPPFVDTVVVVAGLSAMGRPLAVDCVHRPERFAELSGLSIGEPINIEALARLLLHPLGGLKNIPPTARRVALLNQADTADLQAAGQRLASHLLPTFHSVIISSLNPPTINHSPSAIGFTLYSVHEPVAGVILAAGASQRLGQPKQLLEWRGKPFVRQIAETALQADLSPVVVVSGAHGAAVQAAVQDLPLIAAYNPDWEGGQSTSIRVGLQHIPRERGAVIFLLADQPQTPPILLRALIERHALTLAPIVAPLVRGQRANPVLFDHNTFPDLLALTGETGGRALFSRYPIEWLEWHDESMLLDVDTQEDYYRLTG